MPCCRSNHRHRGVPVVDDGGLALVLRIPQHVIGVAHLRDVGLHLVVTPTDAGGVDRVGDAVAPVLVVPGVGEGRPHILDVGDVAVVQRLHQLARHQPADLVVAGEVDVVVDAAAADLGDRLVGVVEGRDLHLDAVLFLERLDRVRARVVGIGVELQRRALLRREAVFDGLVVVGDVPLDRAVRRGERQRRLTRGRPGLRARRKEGGQRRCRGSKDCCSRQKLSSGRTVAVRSDGSWHLGPPRCFRVLSLVGLSHRLNAQSTVLEWRFYRVFIGGGKPCG